MLLVSCARLGDGLRVALARGVWFVVCGPRCVCLVWVNPWGFGCADTRGRGPGGPDVRPREGELEELMIEDNLSALLRY